MAALGRSDAGRVAAPTGGGAMPAELSAMLSQAFASQGQLTSAKQEVFVPLWRVRPESQKNINRGQFGDGMSSDGGGKFTQGGRFTVGGPSPTDLSITADVAMSAFLDMDPQERNEFKDKALKSGLLRMGEDGYVSDAEVFSAWQKATGAAADYNATKGKDKWISPWEAVDRLGISGAAGKNGGYDPFKPRTTTQTTKRDFTSGSGLGNIMGTMREIFRSEMGREPTEDEVKVYAAITQKAYDANPEVQKSTSTTGPDGNTSVVQSASGGIDVGETLLDQVRNDPERDAFQAGSTYFEAAMQALGAIA